MLLKCFGEDEDIFEVNKYLPFEDEVMKNIIHEILKGTKWVSELKEHHHAGEFEQFQIGSKYSFSLFIFPNTDIIVFPLDVKLCEILCTLEFVHQLRDERKGILVFYGNRI
jgi:hypothetical protein